MRTASWLQRGASLVIAAAAFDAAATDRCAFGKTVDKVRRRNKPDVDEVAADASDKPSARRKPKPATPPAYIESNRNRNRSHIHTIDGQTKVKCRRVVPTQTNKQTNEQQTMSFEPWRRQRATTARRLSGTTAKSNQRRTTNVARVECSYVPDSEQRRRPREDQ